MPDRILRRPDVEGRTGLSRSGLYAAIKVGDFPRPMKITTRAVGWPESVITEWIESQIKAGREANK